MSSNPFKFDQPTGYQGDAAWKQPYVVEKENYLGLVGFIVSMVGLVFTCGIASPLGLLLSLFGLFSRPRGYAIAGVITGFIGSIWIVLLIGAFWVMAAVGIAAKPAIEQGITALGETATNLNQMSDAKAKIEAFRAQNDRLPDGVEGNKIVAEFKDAQGNSLRYEVEGDSFKIRCAGSDEKFETPDDLDTMQMDAPLKAMEEMNRAAKEAHEHPHGQDEAVPEIKLP